MMMATISAASVFGFIFGGGNGEEDVTMGSMWWLIYAGVSCFLVLFAGIMSGLTLGLMSIGLVDLEVLQQGGTPTEKKQAAAILPVVQKQHQLLVTLLLCNAASMEALPIFLDKMFNPVIAIVLSVTFVLFFGEVIPQAICTQYGLSVGANLVWLVRILMFICYPITYPIAKMLDYLLGHSQSALFRRAHLKAFVSIHGKDAGKGGELTHDETTIICGALDLTEKTAREAMTPIASTFSLNVDCKLDWEAIGKIIARGHSRVPIYTGNHGNIIGLLLVKSLLTVRPETETPVSAISIRKIPRVPADMPLYDILNEFQKGGSHMAAVVRTKDKTKNVPILIDNELIEDKRESDSGGMSNLNNTILEKSNNVVINVEEDRHNKVFDVHHKLVPSKTGETAASNGSQALDDAEEGEVVGIITLEDVFEELLQEEIVDETDEYVDVHRKIRVAAAAAASSIARTPSLRKAAAFRANSIMRHGQQSTLGMTPKKHVEDESKSLKEPLLPNKK